MKKATLLIKNAKQLLTLSSYKKGPRVGKEMEDLGLVEEQCLSKLYNEAEEITKILVASSKTAKQGMTKSQPVP